MKILKTMAKGLAAFTVAVLTVLAGAAAIGSFFYLVYSMGYSMEAANYWVFHAHATNPNDAYGMLWVILGFLEFVAIFLLSCYVIGQDIEAGRDSAQIAILLLYLLSFGITYQLGADGITYQLVPKVPVGGNTVIAFVSLVNSLALLFTPKKKGDTQ